MDQYESYRVCCGTGGGLIVALVLCVGFVKGLTMIYVFCLGEKIRKTKIKNYFTLYFWPISKYT